MVCRGETFVYTSNKHLVEQPVWSRPARLNNDHIDVVVTVVTAYVIITEAVGSGLAERCNHLSAIISCKPLYHYKSVNIDVQTIISPIRTVI